MEEFIFICSLIWCILCIILFFKVWGACDNIKRLTKKFIPEYKTSTPESKEDIDKWLSEK